MTEANGTSTVEAMQVDESIVNEIEHSNNENASPDTSMEMDKTVSDKDLSFDTSVKSVANSAKKVKLSKQERDKLKAEREKLREEREKLRVEREKARLEKAKAKVELEKQKLERDQKLKEERERKQNELQEKKLKLEQEKQEKMRLKEEEKEKREREKKEKEEERVRLREAKEKEKQKRLEEKQAMEEEQRKKAELKAKLEEEKLEKSRNFMSNFLKKSQHGNENQNSMNARASNKEETFRAGLPVPKYLLDQFDSHAFLSQVKLQNESTENLYLNAFLTGKIKPHSLKDNLIVDEDVVEELPDEYRNSEFIYIKFHENVKPPYFGPMPFKSASVSGRTPIARDTTIDYELDSDEEWEEGGPGESLSGSESEGEVDKDDYEIDDFLVPHGYLSDDENEAPDEDVPPDAVKTGPLLKEQTLLAERSRRFTQVLKPQVIGCVWFTDKNLFPDKFQFLQKFKAVSVPK